MADGPLAGLAALAREVGDLKRLRDATDSDSLATRLFRRAWSALCACAPAHDVALVTTADAIAAARLGGIDRAVLGRAGLSATEADAVLRRGLDELASLVPGTLVPHLGAHVGRPLPSAPAPAFVDALACQPRAGATCPGKPRLMLEPPENHADHCLLVAVLGVCAAPTFDADPTAVFLAGLAHHLHNAVLPDSGFSGETLLGEHLAPIMARLFDDAVRQLPQALQVPVWHALGLIRDAETPIGRAFHTADVIDRVQQMAHFARVAAFTTDQALDDLQLVHAGPVQAFHQRILREAGLP